LLQRALDSLDRMGGNRFEEDFADFESTVNSHANMASIQTFGAERGMADSM
jgi:hypothetical protein